MNRNGSRSTISVTMKITNTGRKRGSRGEIKNDNKRGKRCPYCGNEEMIETIQGVTFAKVTALDIKAISPIDCETAVYGQFYYFDEL